MSQIDCITELTTYAKILYTMETRKIRIGLTIIIVVIIGIICAGKVCVDANNTIQKWKHQVLYEIECSSIDNFLILSSACYQYIEGNPLKEYPRFILILTKYDVVQSELDIIIDNKIKQFDNLLEIKQQKLQFIDNSIDNKALSAVTIKRDSLNRYFLERIGVVYEFDCSLDNPIKRSTFDSTIAYEQAKQELKQKNYELALQYIDYSISEYRMIPAYLTLKEDITNAIATTR